MTTDDPATVVLRARQMLKARDGKTSADQLIASLRAMLAPLVQQKVALPEGAAQKLDEISEALEGADGAFDDKQRDALDLLLLGLWIRVELSAGPPHGS